MSYIINIVHDKGDQHDNNNSFIWFRYGEHSFNTFRIERRYASVNLHYGIYVGYIFIYNRLASTSSNRVKLLARRHRIQYYYYTSNNNSNNKY
jgi:hypothetical protein